MKSIWDLPTRVTHWALALCVVLNLFITDDGETLHQWLGYLAVLLIAFRFVWGRFHSTPKRPNPIASLVYIGIWTCIFILGISGFMMGLDAFWGEEWLQKTHDYSSTVLQALILAHLLGVTLDSIRYKRRTWLHMITGKPF